ncbi:DUF1194 domain-containing protein [Haloferula sp. BvORR071]|uniref:DUF1194 domain-containing protein n=1 Tax=Haloferula sp. BvORR071 TaxID=1396141 RepID=UPI002240EF62|nr:DUF1194 domain-containing protein [Haloferula sp. BvORR071]
MWSFRSLLAMSVGIALVGLTPQADAVAVDSELLFLVDINQTGLNNNQFDRLLQGYGDAMTSSQVLDSIQSGALGKIAVSLVFYGGTSSQTVGIPWMKIGSLADAQQFSNMVQALSRPFSISSPSISSALGFATNYFGTETGGASNGFESTAQVVEVAVSTLPLIPNPAADKAARDGALAAGVDVINSIAVGNRSNTVASYFASNVIGGEVGGVAASSDRGNINGGFNDFVATHVGSSVEGAAVESQSAVPEPTSAICLIPAAGILLLRRRREASISSERA